jgi:glycerol-3-phosphate acyltransferase PlsY
VDFARYIAVVLMGYFVGSLPTGYLLARLKGVDIRTVGSGNIGATNVLRILGKPAGIFVLVMDGLKGFAACTWLCDLVMNLVGVPREHAALCHVLAGIAAVMGHNFTFWLWFKGGKGIATTAGVYFALAPLAAGIALAVWTIIFAATRYVSLASIAAAIALPSAVWLTQRSVLLGIVTSALGLLAIWKHKGNIARLLNGTERRLGSKSPAQEAAR